MSGNSLSAQERLFVSEYLKDQSATAAFIRTGYKGKNARVLGPRMYAKVSVRAAIDTELAKIHERAGVTHERILNALLVIAESDVRKLYTPEGAMVPLRELPDSIALAVSGVDVDELFEHTSHGGRDQIGVTKKIRLWDKVKALELLGKHLKMWTERIEGSGPNGGPLVKVPQIDFSGLTTAELKKLAGMSDDARK